MRQGLVRLAAAVVLGLAGSYLVLWAWTLGSAGGAREGGSTEVVVAPRPDLGRHTAEHLPDPLAAAVAGQGVPLPTLVPPLPGQPLSAGPGQAETAVESLGVVPHVTRSGNTHREFVAPEVFEAFYADATDDAIVLAQAHLESRVFGLIEAVVQSRVAAGLVDDQEVIDLEGVSADELRERDQERGGQSDGLYHNVSSERLANGLLMRKYTTVPWDQHVGVYDLQDELYWLRHERKRRSRAGTR